MTEADSDSPDCSTADAHTGHWSTVSGAGRYRRREDVTVRGGLVISRRPLVASRLNEAAAQVVAQLDDDRFERPADVADRIGTDRDAVADLLDQLHRRGVLEWSPDRDPSHRPPTSIVVTVRNAKDELRGCLDAIADLEYPSYEVVVVDDGSTDGTPAAARSHPLAAVDRLRVVEVGSPGSPLGIGASRNRGVEAASYDVIAFTDADCRPRPNWLAELVPCTAVHDVVGGRVRPRGDAAVDIYEGINASLDMGAHAGKVDPDGATPYLPTANLVGRRGVFETIPFPDRNVAEDVEVCWRAIDADYDVVYAAEGVVEHRYRNRPTTFAKRRATYAASEALLARRFGRGDCVPLSFAAFLGTCLLIAAVAHRITGFFGGPVSVTTSVSVGTSSLLAVSGTTILLVPPLSRLSVQYMRLRPAVSFAEVIESGLRGLLSVSYSIAREVTRYYSLPLASAGFALVFTGIVFDGWWIAFGTTVLVGLVVTVAFPPAVEYLVHGRSISPLAYGRWYLLDHVGYQLGAYRGAVEHRTIAHIAPHRRFRLEGLVSRVVTPLRATAQAGDVREVTIEDASARFVVGTSAEKWWFEGDGRSGGGDEAIGLGSEKPVLEDLLKRLCDGDRFLDVGANVGLYSCLVGDRLGDERIIAVEPFPPNADRLEANLERNEIDAEVRRIAVSDQEGSECLRTVGDKAGTGEHTLLKASERSQLEERGRLDVEVRPGDQLVGDDPPTVAKIDVEGAELRALRGLSRLLSDDGCRLVYCEVHPTSLAERGNSVTDVRDYLREYGFAVEQIGSGSEREDGTTGRRDASVTPYVLRGTRPGRPDTEDR